MEFFPRNSNINILMWPNLTKWRWRHHTISLRRKMITIPNHHFSISNLRIARIHLHLHFVYIMAHLINICSNSSYRDFLKVQLPANEQALSIFYKFSAVDQYGDHMSRPTQLFGRSNAWTKIYTWSKSSVVPNVFTSYPRFIIMYLFLTYPC